MKKITKYMRIARKEAEKSNDEFRFGSVVVAGKNIISRSFNQGSKTHPLQARMYPERVGTGLHAEVAALRGLRPYDVAGGEIYVYRLRDEGIPGKACPCSKCLEIIQSFNISRVFYSMDFDGQYGVICL